MAGKKGCGGVLRLRLLRRQKSSAAKMARAARMGMMTAAAISPLVMPCLWAADTSGRAVPSLLEGGISVAKEALEASVVGSVSSCFSDFVPDVASPADTHQSSSRASLSAALSRPRLMSS